MDKLLNRFWSILFFLVPVLGVAVFVISPYYDHWLPEDVSKNGHLIDHLFMVILYLTGFVFVITNLALAWFMWRYSGCSNKKPIAFVHGSHALEITWTSIPAAILLFVALYQMTAWSDSRLRRPDLGPDGIPGTADDMPPTVEVMARQFEWRFRYPGPDGVIGTIDDILTVNELILPPNEEVLISLKSEDVLHSFFLPNLRVKQDAVPGQKIPVWFEGVRPGTYELVCAELCGWGHYKMKGHVRFTESREAFDLEIEQLRQRQMATQLIQTTEGEVADE